MTINTKQVLLNYDNSELTYDTQEGEKIVSKPLTVLDAIITSINQAYPQEIKTPQQVISIAGLSTKFYQSEDVEITETDKAFITERVMMAVQYGMWKPVVYARICELFAETRSAEQVTN